MVFHYFLVFLGAFIFDVVPFPLPPAFTIMVFLQITFKLSIWPVVAIGVAGSITGRWILTLYISKVSGKIFKKAKNEDVEFLGKKMKQNGWKSQLFVVVYSLMPLPTTPLFLAAGMSKIKPIYIIPAFFIGKFTSDAISVALGKYAAENTADLIHGLVSWKSVVGLLGGLMLVFVLLFIDFKTLIEKKKFKLKFQIWNKT